jgi:hypothetical protein
MFVRSQENQTSSKDTAAVSLTSSAQSPGEFPCVEPQQILVGITTRDFWSTERNEHANTGLPLVRERSPSRLSQLRLGEHGPDTGAACLVDQCGELPRTQLASRSRIEDANRLRGLERRTSSPGEDLHRPVIIAVIAVMMMQMSVVQVVSVVAVRNHRMVAVLGGLSIVQVTGML